MAVRCTEMCTHIFLTGEKRVGKSTLLRKMLAARDGTVGGFFTVKTDTVCPSRPSVHLLRAAAGERPTRDNLLFFCGEPWSDAAAQRFDALGCEALADATGASWIVMDELGPAEARAEQFQSAVFRALDGSTPVLGVIQRAESSFLESVAAHPCVRVVEVTRENRDQLLPMLT